MALVTDVQPNEHGRDLLDDAGILQLSAVEGANSRNFARQFADALSTFFIIAANDHIAINRTTLLQKVRGQIVKRRNYCDPFGNKFSSLLCSRTLPYAESARRFPADAGRQRYSCVHKNLPGTQRRFDVLQHVSLRFKGHREDDNL